MTEQKSKFEKLGLKELVAMGVGGMVGDGIFSVLGLRWLYPVMQRPSRLPWGVSLPF
jgi:hypothetical protein